MVAQIATGEIEEPTTLDDGKDPAAKALGAKGGKARAEALTPEQRAEIARERLVHAGRRRIIKREFESIPLAGHNLINCMNELLPTVSVSYGQAL